MRKKSLTKIFMFAAVLTECLALSFCGIAIDPGNNNPAADAVPPVLTIISLSNGQEVGTIYSLVGGVIDSASGVKAVYVKINSGNYHPVFISGGIWYTNIPFPAYGIYSNYIFAVDNANNSNEVSSVWVVRAPIPAVIITTPVNGNYTTNFNITISGYSSIDLPYSIEKVQVQVNSGEWADAVGTMSWSKEITLIIGTNSLKARAIGSNNKTNESFIYKVINNFPDKFIAFDAMWHDNFGCSVAVSADGGTLIVGAEWEEDVIENFGSVYLYQWHGSACVTNKIVAYDGAAHDNFGHCVAVSSDGSTFIVGSYLDDDMGYQSGSVYRFKWNGTAWETAKFVAYDGAAGDNFGCSLAISADGNTVIVGVEGDDDMGSGSGSAYRFHWNGSIWETNKFVAYDGAVGDYFGHCVAVSADGNTIIVGVEYDDDMGDVSGSAYRFHWNGTAWETNKFVAYDGEANNNFGCSVAVSSDGNTFIAGAYRDNDMGNGSGSVYRFHWNGTAWETNKFVAFDGAATDYLGYSVAVSSDGNTFIAGAYSDSTNGGSGVDSGSVYRFKWNGTAWETNKFVAYDRKPYGYFGGSVAVSGDGNTIIVGAYFKPEENKVQEAVYRFICGNE